MTPPLVLLKPVRNSAQATAGLADRAAAGVVDMSPAALAISAPPSSVPPVAIECVGQRRLALSLRLPPLLMRLLARFDARFCIGRGLSVPMFSRRPALVTTS
jgi:hypothetical protein